MSLHAISDDGTLHWKCLGLGEKCQNPITIHISHNGVQWHPRSDGFVIMPPCPACGAQMMVNTAFSGEDLQIGNAQQYGMVPQQMTVPHAITGEQIPVMIPAFMPIGANPAIARHKKLAELMDVHGKIRPELEQEDGGDTSPRIPIVEPATPS